MHGLALLCCWWVSCSMSSSNVAGKLRELLSAHGLQCLGMLKPDYAWPLYRISRVVEGLHMHACFRRSLRILPILFVGFVALSPSARCELMDSATAEQMRPIEPSPTDAAKPARKAANKRLSKTARELGGADERDAAGMPRLTEAEAKEALDQELSLKVGKQMRSDDYPDEARRQRWTGTALVEVLIAADGLIKRVELARTSGFPIL